MVRPEQGTAAGAQAPAASREPRGLVVSMSETMTKSCTGCGEAKVAMEFPKLHGQTGRRDECRSCVAAMTEKPCQKCSVVKPLEEYGRRKDTVDGHHGACKECLRDYGKARYVPRPRRPAFDGTEKDCSKCHEVKPLEEFPRGRTGRGGRRADCRSCVAAYNHGRLEEGRESTARWRAANPEYTRTFHDENRERLNERRRAHRAANPHHDWGSDYRKRARKAGCIPVVRSFTKEELIAHWGNGERCVWCDGPFEEIDHLFPVALGAVHAVETVAPSCSGCNGAGGRDVARFVRGLTEQEKYVCTVVSAARARLAPIA